MVDSHILFYLSSFVKVSSNNPLAVQSTVTTIKKQTKPDNFSLRFNHHVQRKTSLFSFGALVTDPINAFCIIPPIKDCTLKLK